MVACAAANATLDVIFGEGLLENAEKRGGQLLAGLRDLKARHATIGNVRGKGLMVAIEFVKPGEGDGRVPNPAMVSAVIAKLLARHVIVLPCGTWNHIIRFIPPLVTTEEEIAITLATLADCLGAAGG